MQRSRREKGTVCQDLFVQQALRMLEKQVLFVLENRIDY